jgi:hypothetical protein
VSDTVIYPGAAHLPKHKDLVRAISREYPYSRFTYHENDLVCRGESDSRNIDVLRAFAAGFVAACKEDP